MRYLILIAVLLGTSVYPTPIIIDGKCVLFCDGVK